MPGKKKRISKLKRRIRELEKQIKEMKPKSSGTSPLAPRGGFPSLPVVKGVEFASVAAGVRYSGRSDVMLTRAASGSTIAGALTRSTTRSAAVRDCERKLAAHAGQSRSESLAVLVNSGNANAFTGRDGEESVAVLAAAAGARLGISPESVFTASTGVIGEMLPVQVISGAIDELAEGLSAVRLEDAARAIMTTDTYPKGAGTKFEIADTEVAICGIAKGSGMIEPDMATMLAFVFTDATVRQDILQRMVEAACGRTFNSITVDGDTSTSDTLLTIATGAAGAPGIDSMDSPAARTFASELESVMSDLAKQVVRDGEGATKFVEVRVEGAVSDTDAQKVAKSVANSPLVKTALAGEDPNWGRIVMAVGKSGAEADRDRLSIRFGDLEVAEAGEVSASHSEEDAARYMQNDELVIGVDLGLGNGTATVWTCDFSQGYVAINADYRS